MPLLVFHQVAFPGAAGLLRDGETPMVFFISCDTYSAIDKQVVSPVDLIPATVTQCLKKSLTLEIKYRGREVT